MPCTTVAFKLAAVACATVKLPVPAFAVTVPSTVSEDPLSSTEIAPPKSAIPTLPAESVAMAEKSPSAEVLEAAASFLTPRIMVPVSPPAEAASSVCTDTKPVPALAVTVPSTVKEAPLSSTETTPVESEAMVTLRAADSTPPPDAMAVVESNVPSTSFILW